MAVIQKNGLLHYIDDSGNVYVLYPVTTLDNVSGTGKLLLSEDGENVKTVAGTEINLVPDWAKQPNKPTYKWDEIADKPDNIGGGSENAVEYTAQTLTENQKTQARTNISAAPAYTYSATDITAGGASIGEGRLHFVYE